jgi:NOL1/NOP2/fmu family ribosome biogenesis protein
MTVLTNKEKKELEKTLDENYGSSDVLTEFVVLKSGKEDKLWIAQKGVFQINTKGLRVQNVGLYFGRLDRGVLRLSIEGAQLVAKTATKNIVELNKEQLWDFLRGFNVAATKKTNTRDKSYVLVRFGTDCLGIAKLVGNELENVLPKSRKLISLTKEKEEDLYVKGDLIKA